MAEDQPRFLGFERGLSDVCLRELKWTKRVVFEKKGGLSLKNEGVWGSVQEEKEGVGDQIILISPYTIRASFTSFTPLVPSRVSGRGYKIGPVCAFVYLPVSALLVEPFDVQT